MTDINMHRLRMWKLLTSAVGLSVGEVLSVRAFVRSLLVGPRLPRDAVVVEIVGINPLADAHSAAISIAGQLAAQGAGDVLDMRKLSTLPHPDVADMVAFNPYTLIALIRLPLTPQGRISSDNFMRIPAFVRINLDHVRVVFAARPPWCPRCKSNAPSFHALSGCTRSRSGLRQS
ncbi:uncharacterized protein SRS1_14353 [Sporisorium reilianum f. sp. reilianum]|uniref:Uncharacterized protein n=1 Tax=Sporisorium reilianum f. sp. reilianum TaxID=72559 RepID=A0A2N8UF31_9BASI|nr:uncharacterized protein SRS1_14353 [Sporisorium reilianum f. sp. reilianum]